MLLFSFLQMLCKYYKNSARANHLNQNQPTLMYIDVGVSNFNTISLHTQEQMLKGANLIFGSNCSNVKHGDFQLTMGFGVYVSFIPSNFIISSHIFLHTANYPKDPVSFLNNKTLYCAKRDIVPNAVLWHFHRGFFFIFKDIL